MSIVTKIFVVLVALLSIVLVAMIVPFVASVENYREVIETERSKAQAAEARRAAIATEHNNAVVRLTQVQDAKNAEIATLRSEVSRISTQNITLQNDLAAEKLINSETVAELKRLAAAEANNHALLRAQLEELSSLRSDRVRLQQELSSLVDQNNVLAGQIDGLTRQNRLLTENLTEAEAMVAQLTDRWNRIPEDVRNQVTGEALTVREGYVPEVVIQGQITRVRELDGVTFIEVNVGQRDAVAENMKFTIHRDNQFLGTLLITTVDPTVSVGRLQLASADTEIREGDNVLTGPGM